MQAARCYLVAAWDATVRSVLKQAAAMRAASMNARTRRGAASSLSSGVLANQSRQQLWMVALALLPILSLLVTAQVAFATVSPADNPNSVVQIDFSRKYEALEIPQCARDQVVTVTLADREVACLLPHRASSGLEPLDKLKQFLTATPDAEPETTLLEYESVVTQQGIPDPKDCPRPSRLSTKLHVGSPELQSYLRAARLRWLLDRCFRFSDVEARDWKYELCVGRKITLFKGNALTGKMIGKTLFELGTYNSSADQLWADGTMTQWYTGGTEGRQTEVKFVCGDTHPKVKGISGPQEGKYHVWLEAPMFCDYRDDAVQPALSEFLLRSLEGWCSTFTTDGWWSYEYCHPDSLVQFHKDADGSVTGRMYLLGTLHASGDPAEMIFKRPNPEEPTLRGSDSLPPKASGKPRFKFLPVQIIDKPLKVSKNPDPAANKVLALQLTNGTVCEGTDKQRSARVLFECPTDFPLLATHRIVHIEETSFCSYDLVVHTPLVCPHPKLQPPRPLDPQAVLGYPTRRTFVHSLTPASWKGLTVAEPPAEAEARPANKKAVSAKLEAVPDGALRLFEDGRSVDEFGFSPYIRKRASVKEPRFMIGDVVRHRWWQYKAVVLSWDNACRATGSWIQKAYEVYPRELRSRPHYLLLVDTQDDSTKDRPLYAYVPEASMGSSPQQR
ncbi:hypothetical protein Esti_002764 [Eimeria stiedai]